MPDPHEQLTDAYVECLKEAYVKLRRRLRPDYTGKLGRVPEDHWRRCAQLLAGHNLDPYAFVQWVFDLMLLHAADVYENQACSLNLAQNFVCERPQHEQRVRLAVRLQAQQVARRVKSGETLKEILTDPYNEMSAVFKFAAAWSEGDYELAEQWREDASQMMLFEPLYKELLGEFLTPKEGVSVHEQRTA